MKEQPVSQMGSNYWLFDDLTQGVSVKKPPSSTIPSEVTVIIFTATQN
jgi:hypothetical protein